MFGRATITLGIAPHSIVGDFLRPAFSASRLQHVPDLHSKYALRPHHVWKYGRHQTTCQKYNGLPYSIGRVGDHKNLSH